MPFRSLMQSDKRFSGSAGALARLKQRVRSTRRCIYQLRPPGIQRKRARAPAVPAIHLTGEARTKGTVCRAVLLIDAERQAFFWDCGRPRAPQVTRPLNSPLHLSTPTTWHSMKAGEGARGPNNSLDPCATATVAFSI